MKKLKITITEKSKLISSFNLFNFRDEIVNIMYKETVANSSRDSMTFYVLIFFLSLKVGKKTLLRDLFDTNIPKLRSLNKLLSAKKRLKKGEYGELVKKAGLEDVFKYDVFFLLIKAIINSDRIFTKFKEYFKQNPETEKELKGVIKEYKETFIGFKDEFERNLIIDDRWDDRGEYHDLSKSVYRTITMRTSRRLDLTLHKFAEVKSVTSRSPISVQILQCIDPQIVTHVWDTHNLAEYAKHIWAAANGSPIISDTVAGGIVLLADKWFRLRSTDAKKDRKKKNLAKIEFDIARAKVEEDKKQTSLVEILVKSVLSSNEFLKSEVLRLNSALAEVRKSTYSSPAKEKEIKELTDRIKKLENIEIDVEEEKDK